MSRRSWAEDDIKLARRMRAAGHSYEEIDWALRRRAGSTEWQPKGADHGHNVRPIRVPDDLSAERDVLVAARDRGALARNFFSDPPAAATAVCK